MHLLDDASRQIAEQTATTALIIEDEPMIALDVAQQLRQLGHKVIGVARTHDEAVAIVKTHSPGVVIADIQLAAQTLGQTIYPVRVNSARDFEQAFASIVQRGAGALLVTSAALFTNRRDELVALASRHAIPAIYSFREFAGSGGLISYGTNAADGYRQAGVYTARILKGEKPANLPVMQPTKFELIVNLKTAKTLGIAVPPTLLARADEVIE